MCGTAGLFIGCPFENFCSKKSLGLLNGNTDSHVYESRLKDWDRKASVRAKPRRSINPNEISSSVFFPPEFIPLARHQEIKNLRPEYSKMVPIQHLYRYLDFTVKLEHLVVNQTTLAIAQGQLGFDLPDEMVFDAYKLYCDEAYHAFFSIDLLKQVESLTNVQPKLRPVPHFIEKLSKIQQSLPDQCSRSLAEIFFVIVSETLISATLSQIPRDKNVIGAVRNAIGDHAEDEGRHHAYFASLLKIIWPQLTPKQQGTVGVLLPKFILTFLSPDYDGLRFELQQYGLSANTVENILFDVYPESLVVSSARLAGKAAIRHCEETGMLSHSIIRDAFAESGLLE